MKFFHILIILLLIIFVNSSYKILSQKEFYEKVRSDKLGKNFYIKIIDNLKKILNYYVYIDLLKNPPQPDFDPNYHSKVDTMEYLDNLKNKITDETNSYDFYRDIRLLIDSYKDAHMSYGFQGFGYEKYVLLCPIQLRTKIDKDNKAYSIAEAEFDESFFRNGTEIFKIINQNKGEPIKSINGKTPFDFIQTFGNPYFQLKNEHASYAFKTHQYSSAFILYFPLNSEDISNFTVEYENGVIFQTDLAIVEIVKDYSENHIFFQNEKIEKEFINFIDKKLNEDYGVLKGLNELIVEFEKNNKIKNMNNFLSKKSDIIYDNILSEKNEINWNYQYINGDAATFQCRVDEENKMNIYHLKTFMFNDQELAYDLFKNCTNLFSENTYNIIVILDFNGGGIEQFAQTMVEYIQPYISSRFYSSLRQGEYLNLYYDSFFSDYSIRETCKVPDKDYVLSHSELIKYDNIINNITYAYTRFGQLRNEFNEAKSLIKNKRKPTEILIFTDGYSASSASLFTKSLQYEGGVIVAGYNGNPKSEKKFDSSQHFSTVINLQGLRQIDNDTIVKLEESGIKFSQICITNNYLNYDNLKVPEEFHVMPVDEVTQIYESFDEEKNYNLFIDTAKTIFKKYETECNKDNNKLTLFNENCKFNVSLAHGGYGCGSDSKWDMNKCIPIYCDDGYFFNNIKGECIKDPCLKDEKREVSSITINFKLIYLLGLLIIIL